MRSTRDQQDSPTTHQRQPNEDAYHHQREVNAVASSFGSLFNSKSSKFHYYTPVHPQREYSTQTNATPLTPTDLLPVSSSPNSPHVERRRQKTSVELYQKHYTLAHTKTTQDLLLPSSLHDIEKLPPMQPEDQVKKEKSNAHTREERKNRPDDSIVDARAREVKYYLDLCHGSTTFPRSKLLKSIAHIPTVLPSRKTKHNRQLNRCLNLKGQGLTAVSMEILAKSVLPTMAKNGLQEIHLSDNPALGSKGMHALLQALQEGQATQIKRLDLSSCHLRNDGALKAVALLLPTSKNQLNTIKLANNLLNDGFIRSFVSLYTQCVPMRRKADLSRLAHLDLRQNNIGARGGVLLGHAIGEVGSALETLLLGWNHLGNSGCDAILLGLTQVKPVTRISRVDFSFNSIDCLNNLQPFLAGTRTLTLVGLDLSHNQLGPKVAEDLVTALSVRNRVQELKIGFNPLGLMGTARLVEVARMNALRTLCIENTIIKLSAIGGGGSSSAASTVGAAGENQKEGAPGTDDGGTTTTADLEHFDLSADVQYIWELAQRVKRAKSVLLMMKARRKYKICIEVEYPPQDRHATNRMFQPVMSWLSGRARRDHGEDTNASGKGGNGQENEEEIEENTDSVFHSRIAESESRSFWDSPHVIGAAFEEDFIKLNWHKVLKLNFTQESKLHDALKSHFVLLKELFHYYAATKSGRAKGGFSITMNGMHTFVDDMGLWPKSKGNAKLDMMFVQAAVDRHKQDALLLKSKRAKYLHKDMDDNFSLGSGTGLNSTSLTKIVNTRHQIAEVHAVRAKIAREQKAKQAKQAKRGGGTPVKSSKKKKKRKASFHQEDSDDDNEKLIAQTQQQQQQQDAKDKLVTTLQQKTKTKKKKSDKEKEQESKSKDDKAAKERKEKRAAARTNAKEKKKQKKDSGSRSFGAQSLRRSEFLGFVFRLAVERFLNSGEVQTAEDAVNKMMEDFIIPNAFKDVGSLVAPRFLFDRNMFRDEKLYFVEIDQVIRDNYLALQAIYAKHSTDETTGSSDNFAYKGRFQEGEVMTLPDFISVVNSMDRPDFIEQCSRRAISIAFVFSQMLCSGDDDAASQASFCEFLESLARLADMCIGRELKGMSIPLSIVFRQVIDSLVRGNQKDVDRFTSGMEKTTAMLAKQVSKSKISWSKEARSSSLDMTMAWMARVKGKVEGTKEVVVGGANATQ